MHLIIPAIPMKYILSIDVKAVFEIYTKQKSVNMAMEGNEVVDESKT